MDYVLIPKPNLSNRDMFFAVLAQFITAMTAVVAVRVIALSTGRWFIQLNTHAATRRPANRPAFGGTVPLFYQMSRVQLNHGNVPLFVRSRILRKFRSISRKNTKRYRGRIAVLQCILQRN